MPIQVYDYRKDNRNLFARPEFRGRFLRMRPGEIGPRHSHDVGQEVFLILEGRCQFEIEGETAVLGPGQLCVAWAGQKHQVRTVGDEPMTMFLVVTPHLEPTHTFWQGEQPMPPRYGAWLAGGQGDQPVPAGTTPALAVRVRDAARLLAEATAAFSTEGDGLAAAIDAANASGDRDAGKAALDAAWTHLRAVAEQFADLEARWNALASRFVESDPDARMTIGPVEAR